LTQLPLANGLQSRSAACNGIVMGTIPGFNNMPNVKFITPVNNQVIPADTSFNLSAQVNNVNLGKFTNAQQNYFSAPCELDSSGNTIGHTHLTVQSIPAIDSTDPVDPRAFVYFKGVDDAGNGAGLVSETVPGGLPAGAYRACTITSCSNHQIINSGVAQRGTMDECVFFTTSGNGAAANGGAAAANGKGSAGANAAAAAASLSTTTAAASSTTTAAAVANNNVKGKGQVAASAATTTAAAAVNGTGQKQAAAAALATSAADAQANAGKAAGKAAGSSSVSSAATATATTATTAKVEPAAVQAGSSASSAKVGFGKGGRH